MAPTTKLEMRRIGEWVATTTTGDQAELDWAPTDRAWQSVSVSSEECPGAQRCPLGSSCFAEAARDRANAADIVVVNTHLYGLDVGCRRHDPARPRRRRHRRGPPARGHHVRHGRHRRSVAAVSRGSAACAAAHHRGAGASSPASPTPAIAVREALAPHLGNRLGPTPARADRRRADRRPAPARRRARRAAGDHDDGRRRQAARSCGPSSSPAAWSSTSTRRSPTASSTSPSSPAARRCHASRSPHSTSGRCCDAGVWDEAHGDPHQRHDPARPLAPRRPPA